MNEAELNALVGSRICHDLISPLGAIGNGVELLTMSGVGAAPEIALISESVESASARIRYFRIAYGAANRGDMIGNTELKSVLDDIFRGARLTVDWKVHEDVPRVEAKLAFLLLQCLESAMPWGGKVLVTRSGGAWNIFASGDRIKVDEELWGLLIDSTKPVDVTPSHVHFALVHPVTQQIDSRLTANIGESSISLSF